MKSVILRIIALTMLLPSALYAQDIDGTWQGTLPIDGGTRTVVKISQSDNGGHRVVLYSIDHGETGLNASSVTLEGSTLRFSIAIFGVSYEGRISGDGASIIGTWTQPPKPVPFTLTRARSEIAWEIPKPLGRMSADASPQFEVATIKPTNPNASRIHTGLGTSLDALIAVAYGARGRQFNVWNKSLDQLIEFGYGVQVRQIVGGPSWMDKEKFDVYGVPDQPGQPSDKQWRMMVQKLIADRFQLVLHHDKKELPVYVLSVAKNGPKLTNNESGRPLPAVGFMMAPDGTMLPGINATMDDLAGILQNVVLERPVINQTGLAGRFDFQFTWTPDESQFNGHSPKPRPSDNPAPSLFTAIQEQLGLKLVSAKVPVDVLVIDHVEKPSEN